jgi:hypothetical protein
MNTLEEAARIFVVSAKPMKLLEFLQACLEGRLDALGAMIGVPEFRGDEHFLPFDLPCLEDLLHGFADLFLGPVTFRSVERAKPCLKRCPGCIFGCDGVGNQRSKAECRDRARFVANPGFAVSNRKRRSERFLALNTKYLRAEKFGRSVWDNLASFQRV